MTDEITIGLERAARWLAAARHERYMDVVTAQLCRALRGVPLLPDHRDEDQKDYDEETEGSMR